MRTHFRAWFTAFLVIASPVLAQEPTGQFGPYHWQNRQLRLPDGDTLTVYRVKLWQFGDGSPPALQFEYEPTFAVSDTACLRSELNRVWPAFAPYVEALHLTGAIVTATNLTRQGAPPLPWTATFKSYGFVLVRGPDATWKVSGERSGRALPKGLGVDVFRIFEADGTRFLPAALQAPK